MAERALPFVNVAMWGGGYYSTATKGAKDVIDGATRLALHAIRRMPDTGTSNPFTLTDMGCADGGTSLDIVRQATTAVQRARAAGFTGAMSEVPNQKPGPHPTLFYISRQPPV